MIFWILLVVLALVAVAVAVSYSQDGEIGLGIVSAFLILGAGGAAGAGILQALCWPIEATQSYTSSTSTVKLVNLADNSATKGEYVGGLFASYGYVDGVRKINFVESHDGYSELGSVDGDSNARIHEGSDDPHMVRHDSVYYNKLLVPWSFAPGIPEYDFYVPAGTISKSFAIGNGGTN